MTTQSEHWLARNFREVFAFPDEAVEWLLGVWNVIQLFDDMADAGCVKRDDLNRAIWGAMVGVPENTFYQKHKAFLTPLVALQIFKWQASDAAERDGKAGAMSYVWRAGYYDLVLATVFLVHGVQSATDIGHRVMELYGENFADYLAEFTNA